MRTNLCVRFPPATIATACIYLAVRTLNIALPESPRPWWELFDATFSELEEIGRTILWLYKQPPAQYIEVRPPEESEEPVEEDKTPPRSEAR